MRTWSVGQRWLLVASVLLIGGGAMPAWAFQNSIVANDAVVLSPKPSAQDTSGTRDEKPLTSSQAVDSMPAPVHGVEISLPPAEPLSSSTLRSASNESLGLGAPSPKMQAMSVESGSTEPATTWLSKFDPRQNEITRVLGALAVVVGLLLLGKAILRRAGGLPPGGERPSGVVEILARYPVARGQQMILMKVARRIVLLHHAGTTMTPISEFSDADEVAGLLGRMESGSNQRSATKFRQTLAEFHAEHESAARFSRPRSLPRGEAQVIDLTRSQGKGIGRILGKRTTR